MECPLFGSFMLEVIESEHGLTVQDFASKSQFDILLEEPVSSFAATDHFLFIRVPNQVIALSSNFDEQRIWSLNLDQTLEWTSFDELKVERKGFQSEKRFPQFGCRTVAKRAARLDYLLGATEKSAFLAQNIDGRTRLLCLSEGASLTVKILQWDLEDGVECRKISCGKDHSLLLDSKGRVYSFGTGTRGELGHGVTNSEPFPHLISSLLSLKATDISTGGWHSAVLSDIGDVYLWGWNESEQLGFSKNQIKVAADPVLFPLDEDTVVKSLACGSRHTVVFTQDGKVFGTGCNKYGQLGSGTSKIIKEIASFDCSVDLMAFAWSTVMIKT